MKRILVIGPDWHGANSRGLASGFRELGHVVEILDIDTFVTVSERTSWLGRGVYKAIRPVLTGIREQEIERRAKLFAPDLIVVFKGNFFSKALFSRLRLLCIPIVNFYPDVSMTAHTHHIRKCLPLYDAIFTTKSFGKRDFKELHYEEKVMYYLPHGFDPDVHRPLRASQRDLHDFGADVSFIGTWSPTKEQTLAFLAREAPAIRLRIWGNQWERSKVPELARCIERRPVVGDLYAMAMCCTKVNLALLSERREGASEGDQITSRTFHVPATGAFMLHKRSKDFATIFEEGRDAACFENDRELVEKTLFYLRNEDERKRIATAGFKKCIENHRLAQRAEEILRVLGFGDNLSNIGSSLVQARRL